MLVVGMAIQLLEQLKNSRFRVPVEKDNERLAEAMKPGTSDVSAREFTSLLFRNSQRRILDSNINLL